MRVTTNLKKLTKAQLILYLKECEEKIRDESILNQVVDALLNAKKKKKAEIYELANKVQTYLVAESIIENSTKSKKESKKENKEESKKENKEETKKKKLTKKKDEPQKEAKEEQKEAKEEPKDEAKESKKKLKKKKDEPKAKFKFPKELKVNDVVYKINNRIKSVESLKKLISQGKKILFANIWTKEHLEEFTYDIYGIVDKEIKEFPNDLDLTVPVIISRNNKIIYTISIYTDVMTVILDEQLKQRNAFGVEFRVYTD